MLPFGNFDNTFRADDSGDAHRRSRRSVSESIKTESSAGTGLSTSMICPLNTSLEDAVGLPAAATLMANVGTLLDRNATVDSKQKIVGEMIERLQTMKYHLSREVVAQVGLYLFLQLFNRMSQWFSSKQRSACRLQYNLYVLAVHRPMRNS